jgi:hypothetical protein
MSTSVISLDKFCHTSTINVALPSFTMKLPALLNHCTVYLMIMDMCFVSILNTGMQEMNWNIIALQPCLFSKPTQWICWSMVFQTTVLRRLTLWSRHFQYNPTLYKTQIPSNFSEMTYWRTKNWYGTTTTKATKSFVHQLKNASCHVMGATKTFSLEKIWHQESFYY